MNAKGVTAVLIWILRFCIHVAASSVLNMTCRQMGDRTTYTILDRPTSVGCSYSYSNGTKHIIAHDTDYEPALVLNKSLDSLITSKCIREVIYEATCDKGHFYSANCTVACTEFRHNKETSDAWPGIVVGVLVAVMIVVVVVVAVVVRKKLKHKYGPPLQDPRSVLTTKAVELEQTGGPPPRPANPGALSPRLMQFCRGVSTKTTTRQLLLCLTLGLALEGSPSDRHLDEGKL